MLSRRCAIFLAKYAGAGSTSVPRRSVRNASMIFVPAGDHDAARRVVENNVEMLQQAKMNPRACLRTVL